MKSIAKLTKGITIIALTTQIGHAPALAGTFVYVSNADEGAAGVNRRAHLSSSGCTPLGAWILCVDEELFRQ